MSAQPLPVGRVLVADDDTNIAELVRMYLEKQGYAVDLAFDGERVLALVREQTYDIAVLDIMMPGVSGLQIVRSLRMYSDLPVILLTARTSDIDKVAGLHLGADDYVTKPFNPWELVARVEAVLRRGGTRIRQPQTERLAIGRLQIDPANREATVSGKPLVLTPKELDLLLTLARFREVALDRRKLLDLVWGTSFVSQRTVDVHIARLREKLTGAGLRIETVWGSGYRMREAEAADAKSAHRPV